MRCPLSRAAALACASIAVSDTDDERSSFIVTGVFGRLSNAAAWVCASAGFGDAAACESATAAVVAKIAGIRNKRNFMGVLVAGKKERCAIARTLRSGWLRRSNCNARATLSRSRERWASQSFGAGSRNAVRLGFAMLRLTARCCGEDENLPCAA